MAGSPVWKVYDASGAYQGAAKSAYLAAVMVGALGDGATIRYDHAWIVWREGQERGGSAAAAPAMVAVEIRSRVDERQREAYLKRDAAWRAETAR